MPNNDVDVKGEGDRLCLLCHALEGVNLDGLIEQVSFADSYGPFIDPTAYRDMLYRVGNMHDLLELARAAQPLQKKWREIIEKVSDADPGFAARYSERARRIEAGDKPGGGDPEGGESHAEHRQLHQARQALTDTAAACDVFEMGRRRHPPMPR